MKYPIGIQSFEKLRDLGFVYVDKTAMVYQMAQNSAYYFLSRPRRFGKSLLVSTLDAYFSGRKDLFSGLAVEKLETEWKKYPVLRIDMSAGNYIDEQALSDKFNEYLEQWEGIYGNEKKGRPLPERFAYIVQRAYEMTGNRRAVILVDEYDKPLLQAIGKPELQDAYRNIMKAFYGVMKSQDQYIQFGFITGVTKFSHVSIFSDLNNLNDITMDGRYADICGISEDDLHEVFDESIRELGKANGMSYEETCLRLKKQYNGYHFRENSIGVYNPFSLLNTFAKKDFQDYWFQTGTPSYLMHLLKNNDYELMKLQGIKVSASDMLNVDAMYTNPIPVLYQSGYLTIKAYNKRRNLYTLDYPNQEVERGFTNFLIPYFTPLEESKRSSFLNDFIDDVEDGKPEQFLTRLQTLFAGNDYRVAGDMEKYFQNSMMLIFKMLGFMADVERATSQGRIDITIQTPDYVYIIEIKLDGTAEEALQQIKTNQYARPFQLDGRKTYIIGVNFSSSTRSIEKWLMESL